MGDGLAQRDGFDPLLVGIFPVAHLVHDRQRVAALGIDRLVERDGRGDGVERGGDLRGRQIERLRDLVDGRLAAVLVGQLLSALQNAIGRVAQRPADADGAVVAQIPPQLPGNHRHTVGRKADVFRGVKVGDGLQKPDAADLKQIVRIFAPAQKPLHHRQDQLEISLHQTATRVHIPLLRALDQPHHLRVRERLQLRCVDAADLDLSLHICYLHLLFLDISSVFPGFPI